MLVVAFGVDALIVAFDLAGRALHLAASIDTGFAAFALAGVVARGICAAKVVVALGVDAAAFAFDQPGVALHFTLASRADGSCRADLAVAGVVRAAVFGAAVAVVVERVDALTLALDGAGVAFEFALAVCTDLARSAGASDIAALAVQRGAAVANVGLGVDALAVAVDFVCAAICRADPGRTDLIGRAAGTGVGSLAVQARAAVVSAGERVDTLVAAADFSRGAVLAALAGRAHHSGRAVLTLIGGGAIGTRSAVPRVAVRVDTFAVAQQFRRQARVGGVVRAVFGQWLTGPIGRRGVG